MPITNMEVKREVGNVSGKEVIFYRVSMLVVDTCGERLIEFSLNENSALRDISRQFDLVARKLVNTNAR